MPQHLEVPFETFPPALSVQGETGETNMVFLFSVFFFSKTITTFKFLFFIFNDYFLKELAFLITHTHIYMYILYNNDYFLKELAFLIKKEKKKIKNLPQFCAKATGRQAQHENVNLILF